MYPEKVEQLADITARSVEQLLEEAMLDSVTEGICTNPGCDYTTRVETDLRHGPCPCCGTNTVASILCLLDMV